jgi:hypothetical protein
MGFRPLSISRIRSFSFSFSFFAASLALVAGCASGSIPARTFDSVVARGLADPSLAPPRPPPERTSTVPVSAWRIEDAKDLEALGDRLVELLAQRHVRMVGLGELYTPWWVPEHPAAYWAARYVIPKLHARLGFKDLVVEYLTQDVPDEDLRAASRGEPAPAADTALMDWYAQDLLRPAKDLGLTLWKAGYAPERGKRLTLEDCALRGSPAGSPPRSNPSFVAIHEEVKRNALSRLLALRAEGKRGVFMGGVEIVELEEEVDFLQAPAFKSDERRYAAARAAGALGADLRALGLDGEYACVFIVSPNHIQHQGRLNEEQYERLWRWKKPTPRIAWRTVGASLKVALLLPYEKHRITSLEARVRTADDGE